jgi:regulator of replication initiation timing
MTMKDLAKENFRLSIENRQLKKKLAKLEREYLELARFAQEREAVRDAKQDHQRIHLHE